MIVSKYYWISCGKDGDLAIAVRSWVLTGRERVIFLRTTDFLRLGPGGNPLTFSRRRTSVGSDSRGRYTLRENLATYPNVEEFRVRLF